jgi:hypothetical protein
VSLALGEHVLVLPVAHDERALAVALANYEREIRDPAPRVTIETVPSSFLRSRLGSSGSLEGIRRP